MPRLRIGLVLESLGLPLRNGLNLAGGLGVQGVQVDAVGDLAPDSLSQTGRKEFRHLLRTLNLELTALNCPLRHGFDVEQGLEARLAYVQKVLNLAYDLGPRITVAFAGSIPQEENHPVRDLLKESLTTLARHGDRVGATLALETGREPPAVTRALLAAVTTGAVGVNLDPASLIANGSDPGAAVRELQQLIVHTHARDARPGRADRGSQEVPLGHGDIDWTAYLGALEEIDYRGWLTLKRGPSPDPVADIRAGVTFLRRLLG
jgi:sugar phosphate isomerase/epimerase